jgi:ABC-type antimicrobial peptide transport system permease subunit
MVVGTGARLAAAGVLVGSAMAWGAGRALESLLAGISPGDAPVWVAAILLCFAMTLAGSLVPAIRAARVDPGTAIRCD